MCGVTEMVVAGLVLSAAATAASAQQQAQQAEFQADQLEDEAQAEETARALRREDRERRRQRVLAQQRVLFGASGFEVDPEILADTSREFAREQFADDFNVGRRSGSLVASAANTRASGRNAITSSVLDFGGGATDTVIRSGALRGQV